MLQITEDPFQEDFVDSLHEATKTLIASLQSETERRFPNLESSKTIGIATMLDPRFKYTCFGIKKCCKKKYSYRTSRSIIKNKTQLSSAIFRTRRPWGRWTKTEKKILYLERIRLYNKHSAHGRNTNVPSSARSTKENPLEWWQTFKYSFPHIAVLARRELNFLATSVPSERLFPKAGNILDDRRTRLGVRKVQQLLFLNLNLKTK